MPTGRSAKARAPECCGRRGSMHSLSPDAQLFDQPFVAREIARMQVVKQPTTLADQTQQSAARMMILLVHAEVFGQLVDPGREQRDLNFRRAAVIGGSSVGLYDFPLAGCWKRHSEFLLSLFPLSLADQINRRGQQSKGRGDREGKYRK
jgi:hypothetical protein